MQNPWIQRANCISFTSAFAQGNKRSFLFTSTSATLTSTYYLGTETYLLYSFSASSFPYDHLTRTFWNLNVNVFIKLNVIIMQALRILWLRKEWGSCWNAHYNSINWVWLMGGGAEDLHLELAPQGMLALLLQRPQMCRSVKTQLLHYLILSSVNRGEIITIL